ncbi:hypothetical protein DV738_g588, partial [Chaetothyriales sp. CBS 135597]
MGFWAFKCLSITPLEMQHVVTLQFQWMPKRSSLKRHRRISPKDDDVKAMLDTLTTWYGDPVTQVNDDDQTGIVAACHVKSCQPLLSGQNFEVKFDGKESKKNALKMKDMIDLQWALIVMASMAGAADPRELYSSNSDDSDDGGMKVEHEVEHEVKHAVEQWLAETEATATARGKQPDPPSAPPSPSPPAPPLPALGAITNLPPRDDTASLGKTQRAQSFKIPRRSENAPP